MANRTMQEREDATRLRECDEYDIQQELYLQKLIFLYTERMSWFDLGFVDTMDFTPAIVHDVYNENLYCMSWLYDSVFSYDTWHL